MDPDTALKDLRELVQFVLNDDTATSNSVALAETFQGLDEWLSNAGYLPLSWGKHWQGARND